VLWCIRALDIQGVEGNSAKFLIHRGDSGEQSFWECTYALPSTASKSVAFLIITLASGVWGGLIVERFEAIHRIFLQLFGGVH
jgi:hypothetical protein